MGSDTAEFERQSSENRPKDSGRFICGTASSMHRLRSSMVEYG
jgi:hypothetical protein